MPRTTTSLVLALTLGAAGGAFACTRTIPNPDHCSNNGGDSYCADRFPDFPLCSDGDNEECNLEDAERTRFGCAAEEELAPGCHDPCGEHNPNCESADGTMSSTGPTTTAPSTTDDPTMGPGPGSDTETETVGETTDGDACEGDDDCTDAGAPFCDAAGMCVACDGMPDPDAACAGADAAAPVCNDGGCVQCTAANAAACDGQTPVCDAAVNTCRGCVEHAECPDSACHLDGGDLGACFAAGDVQNIANATALQTALNGLGADDQAVLVLAAGDYGVTATVSSTAEVAILGNGAATIEGDGGINAVEVTGSAILYLSEVDVSNNDGNGATCIGTAIWLDDSEVRNNAQAGLDISGGCAAHLRRTVVRANSAGGISASGDTTEVRLTNAAVVANTNTSAIAAVVLQSSADIFAVYSTIADNLAGLGDPDSIVCSGSSGEVRNSIVLGAEASSVSGCGGVSFSDNAVDSTALGGSNTDVGPHDDAWFSNPAAGDYGLSASGETTFMNIAMWEDGDPLTDIDGDPIPTDMDSFPGYDQP